MYVGMGCVSLGGLFDIVDTLRVIVQYSLGLRPEIYRRERVLLMRMSM